MMAKRTDQVAAQYEVLRSALTETVPASLNRLLEARANTQMLDGLVRPDGVRISPIATEVAARTQQLGQLLDDIKPLHLEVAEAILANPEGSVPSDSAEPAARQKTYVEAWYYIAHRTKVAVNTKHAFGEARSKFKPAGVSTTRNRLIEHRSGATADYLGNFGVHVDKGLFFGPEPDYQGVVPKEKGKVEQLPDRGFLPNAEEFVVMLDRWLVVAAAEEQQSSDATASPSGNGTLYRRLSSNKEILAISNSFFVEPGFGTTIVPNPHERRAAE